MSYTQADLRDRINAGIQGKIDMLVSPTNTMNEAVREVKTELRIRSGRRKTSLVPNLIRNFYEYQCPTDLESQGIIDIPAQAKRADGEFNLVPSEQFRRSPSLGDIAIDDYNGIRVLLINSKTDESSNDFVSMEQVDLGPASWILFGDAENVAANTDDYVRGNGSIEYDISSAGGTTAGIQIDGINTADLTDFINHPASAFIQARLTSATDVTNIKLRLGQSSSAYYEYTVTARNDGTAFSTGWNELRFDLATPSATVGSPTTTGIDYVVAYMTKATTKISEAGYMFNGLIIKKGKYHDVKYYSKYGWKTSAGVYIENSTDVTDILLADTDEFDLFVKKGRALAAEEVELNQSQTDDRVRAYEKARAQYMLRNPSEDKVNISSYHSY